MKKRRYIVKLNKEMTNATICDTEFKIKSFKDYKEDYIDGGNECAYVFTYNTCIDQNNDEFVLWGDEEIEEEYITYLPKYYEVK